MANFTTWRGGASIVNDIKNKNDTYGDVIVSWKNADGKEIIRTFNFTKEEDKGAYITKNYKGQYIKPKNVGVDLVFEFTQDNVEYYTSAAPDYWERGKKSAKIRRAIRFKLDK